MYRSYERNDELLQCFRFVLEIILSNSKIVLYTNLIILNFLNLTKFYSCKGLFQKDKSTKI